MDGEDVQKDEEDARRIKKMSKGWRRCPKDEEDV